MWYQPQAPQVIGTRAVGPCPSVRDTTPKNNVKSFAIGNVGFGRKGRLPLATHRRCPRRRLWAFQMRTPVAPLSTTSSSTGSTATKATHRHMPVKTLT